MKKRPLPPTTPTLRQPPLMLADIPSPWPRGIDHDNIYLKISEAARLMNWSTTMVRRFVVGGFLRQEYRGIIRLKDFLTCVADYAEFGKGREIHRQYFDRIGSYDDEDEVE